MDTIPQISASALELVGALGWLTSSVCEGENLSPDERYKRITDWADGARGRNPMAFDALTDWLLTDSNWTADKLEENRQTLIVGVIEGFKRQNADLRAALRELEPHGMVNSAVFAAIDDFDAILSGARFASDALVRVLSDFSAISDRAVCEIIAGGRTGPFGTDSVAHFGDINRLKNFDAGVQWALFMPGAVTEQLKRAAITLESFEYKTLPPFKFVGMEAGFDRREEIFRALDAMPEYRFEFDYDIFFMHHFGFGADVGAWHGYLGRFMRPDAPTPEGFVSFDFYDNTHPGPVGPPYLPQFAYAVFAGESDEALHTREGFDADAMYDITRNIILGQNVIIPYPEKYWTAEVMFDRYDGSVHNNGAYVERGDGKIHGGYLFSVERP